MSRVEIDLIVPDPGEYLFVCLYAGHYSMMLCALRSAFTKDGTPIGSRSHGVGPPGLLCLRLSPAA